MLLLAAASAQNASAEKADVLKKMNGEEIVGKIVRVTDKDVTIVYQGETAEYVINKSDIAQIVHSSGRVEVFSQGSAPVPSETRQADPVSMSPSPTEHHNKIAVLPFTFLMDKQPGAEEIGYEAQDATYVFLSKHAPGYTILDTKTTNVLLIKNGVTKDKMAGFTTKEICDILGVEYLIEGTVLQNTGAVTTSNSGYSDVKVNQKDGKVSGASGYGSNVGYSQQTYKVSVNLAIYMDSNASIYNKSHEAFLASNDGSFRGPLEYLLKRCPLYSK